MRPAAAARHDGRCRGRRDVEAVECGLAVNESRSPLNMNVETRVREELSVHNGLGGKRSLPALPLTLRV
jgi:hypothetical protein